MADREEMQNQYSYSAMSSKVVTNRGSKRNLGPTGEVEAIQVGRMGDRVVASKRTVEPATKKRKKHLAKSGSIPITAGEKSVLDLGDDLANSYQPTTDTSRTAYESILTLLADKKFPFASQGSEVLKDAAQEIIEILKDEDHADKQERVSMLLTGKPKDFPTEMFSNMVQLGKQLHDYHDRRGEDVNEKDEDIQDEGVAVVFEEDSDVSGEDDDSGVDENVVVDLSSSEDEEEQQNPQKAFEGVDDDEEQNILVHDKKSSAHMRHLSVHEIDAHFLQRQLSKHITDADESAEKAEEILKIIDIRNKDNDDRRVENQLLVLLGFDLFPVIQLIMKSRAKVWGCVCIKRAKSDAERDEIENALPQAILDEIRGKGEHISSSEILDGSKKTISSGEHDGSSSMEVEEPTVLDLDTVKSSEAAKQCVLPANVRKVTRKGYEEIHVPYQKKPPPNENDLTPLSDLPSWTHSALKGIKRLNPIQSRVCNVALTTSENILLCAPTGAGKTNVACLTMLNVLGQYRNEDDGSFDLSSFKIIYIAPMKALVQEMVKSFSGRLRDYGITVRELSGDSSLTRQQISETQLIVTTPEKWDIVTRAGEGRAFTQLVRLVIIDEIHLLHDDRGPVLESIVARILRQIETTGEPIRLVGLSATLPNYSDVATFLRVDHKKGLFFFDHTFRPIPLQMQYVGISERNAFKRFQLQNEICYEKAAGQRREGYQMLIFVHSRAECGKTARSIRDLARDRDELSLFARDGSATQEILREESESAVNADLKDVLPYGFGIHHAGMSKADRELVEDLFSDRHISVLCSTSTLAWGINAPAHCVIIRGTQFYDPSKGRWAELSPLDVLQMLGRSGRPPFDEFGEGIVMTQHSQLQYYLSLTNLQMPVESQLTKVLPDHLNAEIVSGTVQSIDEAVDWLSYTFLYVRMLQNPFLYGLGEDDLRSDPTLESRRRDLAHTAAAVLEKSHLISYDRKSGTLRATPLGRVASQFYISHTSMSVYVQHMRPTMSEIELLRLFALSGEFKQITVREEEKLELAKLANRVPIPVKESPSEPAAKINMLLQAYISRLKLEGYALVADMAFVQQSAARIMRAIFEIALRQKWSGLAKLCLDFSNMVSYRVWRSQSPLRQFKNVPEIVCRKLERKSDLEWSRYFDLTSSDLRELVGANDAKMGRALYDLVQQFPRLELSAQVQPMTRSLLRVELTMVPSFKFDVDLHGFAQLFHIIIEDVNGDSILHHELFSLRLRDTDEQVVVCSVPILDPLPPVYFVRVISDRWLHSSSSLPIVLSSMILPAKFPPPTELLDLQPLLPSALGEPTLAKIFRFKEFNPIQTQTFHDLFKTSRNCLVCAPSNSGKTVCAIFAILQMFSNNPDGKSVIVCPSESICTRMHEQVVLFLGRLLSAGSIAQLTGEISPDLESLANGKVIVTSTKHWDSLSRRWRQRKAVQAVTLMIFDELHFLGGELGPSIEIVLSRTRYINSQLHEGNSSGIRMIGLSASLANAREVADWMGVSDKSLFNFSPKARPLPLELVFLPFEQAHHSSRLLSMGKPTYNVIKRHTDGDNALVFVPSKRQAQLTAVDLMTYSNSDGRESFFDKKSLELINSTSKNVREPALKQVLLSGICFIHKGMVQSDVDAVLDLYTRKIVKVLVCPADMCWEIKACGDLVVIMGTEAFDGRLGRHADYPAVDLLHMVGRRNPTAGGKCVILCHAPKKENLKKLLYDPLPVESHLDSYLHDPLNSEIVTKTVSSMQDAIDYLTWTFLYRRLPKNPTYYGLKGTTNDLLSEHLSEIVETVVGDLDESKCCKLLDSGEISALNLGMVAAYYQVQYRTIELMASSITEKTKIRGVLEIIAASWEFSSLPIRFGEEKSMKIMTKKLVHRLPEGASYDSNTKALVLLQHHFSRIPVSEEMRDDQKLVLTDTVNLIQALVDVIGSSGWLKPALAAMEISQMTVQGLWNKDNVLKQIPHFTDEIVKRCVSYEGGDSIESVFDILSLDDDVRNSLLQLPDEKMADVAVFCNNYPSVEVTYEIHEKDSVVAGEPVKVLVQLEREIDEDEMTAEDIAGLGQVTAPLYPGNKKESWWIVVGDLGQNNLLSLKRVTLKDKHSAQISFIAPEEPGDYDLNLFCMSDSYLGCDQEYTFSLSVAAPTSDDSDEDSDK